MSDEPTIEELCRPLSAKVDPDLSTRWHSGAGSKKTSRNATYVARRADAQKAFGIGRKPTRGALTSVPDAVKVDP